MAWLADHVQNGARVLDVGLDAARGGRSGVFFKAEAALMGGLGYERRFLKVVELDGKIVRVYEWVQK